MKIKLAPGRFTALKPVFRTVTSAFCSLMLKQSPNHAGLLLTIAALCLRLQQPPQALAALDRLFTIAPSSKRVPWHLKVHFIPAAIVEIARRLRQQFGDHDRAERLLRAGLGILPDDLMVRTALINLLDETLRSNEAEQLAAEGSRLAPHNVEMNLTLGRIQIAQGHFTKAAQTLGALLDHETNNPQAWFEYAKIGRYAYDLPAGTEDMAFARAADCAGSDVGIIQYVALYFLEQRNFSKAADYYGRFLAANPSAREDPSTCREYARALNGCGRLDEAANMIVLGLERCRAIAAVSTGETLEIARREEARLLHEVGRLDEELAVLRSLRELRLAGKPNYDRSEYLPSTPDRLRRLRDIIASRDAIIFLQGPSFADFAARMDELRGLDFVIATIGSFPPIEKELRAHLGRYADLLVVTNPRIARAWYPELEEFLARPSQNLLLTTHYAISNLQEQGKYPKRFIAEHDNRLLFAYPGEGPPLPSRPLHFECGNTFSFCLPLIVVGRPKRIFIVGADGGGHPNLNRPYFYYDDVNTEEPEQEFVSQRPDFYSYKNRPERLAEANRRLRIDAFECSRMVLPSFQFLEQVFDIPIPPVFNVCPHSALRAFPLIDVETAITMLRHPS